MIFSDLDDYDDDHEPVSFSYVIRKNLEEFECDGENPRVKNKQ